MAEQDGTDGIREVCPALDERHGELLGPFLRACYIDSNDPGRPGIHDSRSQYRAHTGQIIGTSTVATTTNSIKWAANGAMGVVRVDPGSYLHAYAQQVDSVGCSNILACETATSTNRGWGTATTLFEYVYKP